MPQDITRMQTVNYLQAQTLKHRTALESEPQCMCAVLTKANRSKFSKSPALNTNAIRTNLYKIVKNPEAAIARTHIVHPT